MTICELSKVSIHHHGNPQSFQRGQAYYRNDPVGSLIQRENTLYAKVEVL